MEKYPIWTLELLKSETYMKDIDEVCNYFIKKIEDSPKAAYIGLFDHYAHTKSLEDGEINSEIKAAKIVVFCFGIKIPTPQVLAVRPRNIAVCDMGDRYIINFLEAPAEDMNNILKKWVEGLRK